MVHLLWENQYFPCFFFSFLGSLSIIGYVLLKRAWFEQEVNLKETWSLVNLIFAVDPMNVNVSLITENFRAANIFFLFYKNQGWVYDLRLY